MSALSQPLEVDLDDGVATFDLFEDDECRLGTDEHRWAAPCERGCLLPVRHSYDEELDLVAEVHIGEGAVQTAIQRHLAGELVAAPHGG